MGEGDILLSSGSTAFVAQNFLIQQVDPDLANDSTRSGTGLITFSGETVTLGASSFLTLNAEDNIEASSRRTTTLYSGATIVLSAGETVNFDSQNTLTVNSDGLLEFEASGSGFSHIRGHSNDINLNAVDQISYTSSVEFEARSQGSMTFTGASVSVDGQHSHMTAQDEDFRLTATNFNWVNTPFIIMEATASFDSTSAHDTNFVVENGGQITFTASNSINFRAIDDGSVIANIAGDMTTVSSNSDITFLAEGMPGALG